MAEARGTEAKAGALEKHGTAEATVLEKKATAEATGVEAMAVAEAKGLEAKAVGVEKHGGAEATVMQQKYNAEATGITEKAKAMKLYNEAGQGHEEFKLRLAKDKDVELAAIEAQQEIATQQAGIVGKALESARIDIVGGETEFFDRITSAIASGKTVDRYVDNSQVLTDVKTTFFNGDPDYFLDKLQGFVGQFNLGSEDVKNLSIAALIAKMMGLTADEAIRGELEKILGMARAAGMADKPAPSLQVS